MIPTAKALGTWLDRVRALRDDWRAWATKWRKALSGSWFAEAPADDWIELFDRTPTTLSSILMREAIKIGKPRVVHIRGTFDRILFVRFEGATCDDKLRRGLEKTFADHIAPFTKGMR